MMNLNERYLVDKQGNRLGVFLDMPNYQKLINRLENLESLSANYEADLIENIDAKANLSELLESVIIKKERLTLIYKNKLFIAAVLLDDLKVIKQLQNDIDVYTHHHSPAVHLDQDLQDFLECKASEKACFTLIYQEKLFLAAVSIKNTDMIQKLEDRIDNADADDALKEEGDSLTAEQVDKILGW
jgi:predicted DNA binding CopG/RHH family protein